MGEADEGRSEEPRGVLIKVGRKEIVLTESRYPSGESGPGPHVHRAHSDCFYVLEGRLVFELGGEQIIIESGGFVCIPPNLVHTFRNEGPGAARFLNFHVPGCAFDEHLRAMAAGEEGGDPRFDTFDPPRDGGLPASAATIRRPHEGEAV